MRMWRGQELESTSAAAGATTGHVWMYVNTYDHDAAGCLVNIWLNRKYISHLTPHIPRGRFQIRTVLPGWYCWLAVIVWFWCFNHGWVGSIVKWRHFSSGLSVFIVSICIFIIIVGKLDSLCTACLARSALCTLTRLSASVKNRAGVNPPLTLTGSLTLQSEKKKAITSLDLVISSPRQGSPRSWKTDYIPVNACRLTDIPG